VLQDHERVGVVISISMLFPWTLFDTRTTTSVVPIASASPTRRLMISRAVLPAIERSTDVTADLLLAGKEPGTYKEPLQCGRE
jgi:hypothetical protein